MGSSISLEQELELARGTRVLDFYFPFSSIIFALELERGGSESEWGEVVQIWVLSWLAG